MSELADFYFAYGSNMNATRVRQRQMGFEDAFPGQLAGYRIAFNKRSLKYPGAGAANVMVSRGEKTEGVVYRLTEPGQITKMDTFEGYPRHYDRRMLSIETRYGKITAWVYIANATFVAEGLKPARWYLNHLLLGREYLSTAYFDVLSRTPCLPSSDNELAF